MKDNFYALVNQDTVSLESEEAFPNHLTSFALLRAGLNFHSHNIRTVWNQF